MHENEGLFTSMNVTRGVEMKVSKLKEPFAKLMLFSPLMVNELYLGCGSFNVALH